LSFASDRLSLSLASAVIRPLSENDANELEVILATKAERAMTRAIANRGDVGGRAQLASVDAPVSLKPDRGRSAEFAHRWV